MCCFGCAHPEGYRKSMAKMRLAAKFHVPVICFIDTPGAYPGIGAEERGQAQVIASAMFEMSRLPTPMVCVVIGEGGSGGALAIGVGDRVADAGARLLFGHQSRRLRGHLLEEPYLQGTGRPGLENDLQGPDATGGHRCGDPEPLGGAHRDHHLMANRLKIYLRNNLRELLALPTDQLLERRYQKFRRMGQFLEGEAAAEAAARLLAESADDRAAARPGNAPHIPLAGQGVAAAR